MDILKSPPLDGSTADSDPPTSQALPRTIRPSTHELSTRCLSPANLQAALEGLHQDGLIVLKAVVDKEHVALLEKAMKEEAGALVGEYLAKNGGMKVEGEGGFNHGITSNILQAPPLTDEKLLFEDVFFNPFTLQLANAYLGANPVWNFCSGNNALANTHGMRQPVHKDVAHYHPQCPFYFIANLPLTPFTFATGATEFWLGTHAHASAADHQLTSTAATTNGETFDPTSVTSNSADSASGISHVQENSREEMTCFVKNDLLEQRRRHRPPIRLLAEPGDIAIRDIRLWHAGMPNETTEDRLMIAFGYQAPWYANHDMRMLLPQSQYVFFQSRRTGCPVEVRAEFLKDDEEVRKRRHRDNFRLQVTELKGI